MPKTHSAIGMYSAMKLRAVRAERRASVSSPTCRRESRWRISPSCPVRSSVAMALYLPSGHCHCTCTSVAGEPPPR